MELNKRFESDKLKRIQIFSGAQLKYIAFISMLIDHVNNALITPLLEKLNEAFEKSGSIIVCIFAKFRKFIYIIS